MTLLVATDDSAAGLDLLFSAHALAAAGRWPLRILHVRETGQEKPLAVPPLIRAQAQVVERDGDPTKEIAASAAESDVTMVALGLRSSPRRGPGHVAEALLKSLARPVIVVPPGARRVESLKRVLVPLEGSPSSSEAMRTADDAFCRRGREIVMLHVVTGDTPAEAGSMPAPRIVDQEHYEWASWQEEFCMRFSQCPEGGRHRVCVRVGKPAEMTLREARDLEAELIVLSWSQELARGRSMVVREVLKSAPCPVLLVPAGRA